MPYGRRQIHTITLSEMREINRSSILELIRSNSPIARTQIATHLHVSLPTVMRIVDELIQNGWVIEDGEREWSGGRKRTRLIFNGAQHLVIGLDLGGTKIFGAVADFNGKFLHEIWVEQPDADTERSFATLCETIAQLIDCARSTGLPVKGIGLGVPGVVEPDTGLVSIAPALSWHNFQLKTRLQEQLKLPIVVENDVNLAALGEMWFAAREEESNLILLTLGTGVGAGVIINGAVYNGSHNMAGEVGYFLPDRQHLWRSYPDFGAIEQLVSEVGIANRARQVLASLRSQSELEALTSSEVFEAVRRQEPWVQTIFEDTVDYLALLVAALATLYDPDVILLGGGLSRSADLLIEPICKRLEGTLLLQPNIRASQLGYRAAILGAIIRLLRITNNYYILQKFV